MPERACRMLYLIGQPGAGKSTLLAAALADAPAPRLIEQPFAHLFYPPDGAQLGKRRDSFSGTDALAMNVQPVVCAFLAPFPYANIVAEGDRLGNDSFFRAIRRMGIDLTVVYLDTPDHIAARRRQERGSEQNGAWVRGRITKAAALAEKWTPPKWRLNGALPVNVLAERLRQHPVIQAIRAVEHIQD